MPRYLLDVSFAVEADSKEQAWERLTRKLLNETEFPKSIRVEYIEVHNIEDDYSQEEDYNL